MQYVLEYIRMKIIHTADIHLDSPLSQVKDCSARRYELLRALSDMAEYANNNGVEAVIVAGDLFDGEFAAEQTVQSVAEIVMRSKAAWYVLQGNHGGSAPYVKLKQLAPNLNLFGDDWTYYNVGNVTICGRELGVDDAARYAALSLDKARYNIVVLHGDIDDDSYGLIDGKTLAHSNANYVALGHRHALAKFNFGSVKACYCGVLEPRGFDEPTKTGFVLIDADKDEVRFVEQHIRRIERAQVDVTGITSDIALETKLADAVASVDKRNYLNVTFVGALTSGLHLNLVANGFLADKFFALRIDDQTTTAYDLAAIAAEVSLRGEFVKLAMDIPDEHTRNEVIKMGLAALSGEDIA